MNARELQDRVDEAHRRLGIPPGMAANRVYKFQDLPAALAGANATGSPPALRFRRKGIAIALWGQTLIASDAELAKTSFRLQTGDDIDFCTNGQSAEFFSLLACVGKARGYFPIWMQGDPGVDWTLIWRNEDPVAGNTVIPKLYISYLEFEPEGT